MLRAPQIVVVWGVLLAAVLYGFPAYGDCVDYGTYIHQVGFIDGFTGYRGPNTEDVALAGPYAYVVVLDHTSPSKGSVFVVDVSDPASPRILNTVSLPTPTLGIAISGSYLYVVGGELTIFSLSDPTLPTMVGSIDLPNVAWDVAVRGTYAYAANSESGLQVIDVSDPASPTIVGNVDTPGAALELAISGNYAFLADGTAGLASIDISNPLTPTIVGSVSNPSTIQHVVASGSYAYVTDKDFGLRIIDITNPESMQIVGGARLLSPAITDSRGLAISGSLVFVADGQGGFPVIDVSNPQAPEIVGGAGTSFGWNVTIAGSHAYLTGLGLTVIDIKNPASSPIVGRVASLRDGVAVSGSHAYVVGNQTVGGVHVAFQVIDISDPGQPRVVGSTGSPISGGVCVAVSGSYAYVSDPKGYGPDSTYLGQLRVIDVSNPALPRLVASLNSNGGKGFPVGPSSGIAVSGDQVYVAGSPGSLEIIDVSTPTSPSTVATVPIPDFPCYAVVVSGQYAYVCGWKNEIKINPLSVTTTTGVRVVDISNPESPVIVGVLTNVTTGSTSGTQWWQLAVDGNYLYAGGYYRLQIIDVSNPASPTIVASNGGVAHDLALQNSEAYLITNSTVQVVDLLDPLSPMTRGFGYLSGGMVAVAGNASNLFVTGAEVGNPGVSGLFIFPLQCSGNPCIVEPAALDIDPSTIVSVGHGPQITAHVELPAPYGPEQLLLETVRLNGNIAPSSTSLLMKDWNHNGVLDAEVEFPRDAVEATLQKGDSVQVMVSGNMDDGCSFTGTATVRVVQPPRPHSKGNEMIGSILPTVHKLYQNSPNPFSSTTSVAFDLPVEGRVAVEVFDLTGREIRSLAEGWYPPGKHTVGWDGKDAAGRPLAEGIYFLHMKTGSFFDTKRIYLQR